MIELCALAHCTVPTSVTGDEDVRADPVRASIRDDGPVLTPAVTSHFDVADLTKISRVGVHARPQISQRLVADDFLACLEPPDEAGIRPKHPVPPDDHGATRALERVMRDAFNSFPLQRTESTGVGLHRRQRTGDSAPDKSYRPHGFSAQSITLSCDGACSAGVAALADVAAVEVLASVVVAVMPKLVTVAGVPASAAASSSSLCKFGCTPAKRRSCRLRPSRSSRCVAPPSFLSLL
ncbi:hypothetical protein PF003_g10279 [Phytophthora fragariae]|nr:hypothetical protein PF003_g10279 [Phytophthora fragariae]